MPTMGQPGGSGGGAGDVDLCAGEAEAPAGAGIALLPFGGVFFVRSFFAGFRTVATDLSSADLGGWYPDGGLQAAVDGLNSCGSVCLFLAPDKPRHLVSTGTTGETLVKPGPKTGNPPVLTERKTAHKCFHIRAQDFAWSRCRYKQ